MNQKHQYLGIVEAGQFKPLGSGAGVGGARRLTTLRIQEAQPPELGELHLGEYDGRAILVSGYADGTWIWSAEVVEVAGQILSLLVKQIFEKNQNLAIA